MYLLNGESAEHLPLSDRGLHYGDGLFETIAVVDGRPQYWERHLQRLQRGCERLSIPMPDTTLFDADLSQLISSGESAILKLLVTRGSGGRGYRTPEEPQPSRISAKHPVPPLDEQLYRDGVTLRRCETRLALQPALAGIKHLNRLEQVLARTEWSDLSIYEGLMFDLDGFVREGVSSNLFWVSGGQLYTPELSRCGITGIMRGEVLRVAAEAGLQCHEVEMGESELLQAEEIFITNSIIGILPVSRYGQWRGEPGPVSLHLLQMIPPPFLGVLQ